MSKTREERLAYHRGYYRRHRDDMLAAQKERDALRRAEIAEYQRSYRASHTQRKRAYNRELYLRQREARLVEQKRRYEKRRGQLLAYCRAWRARNIERQNTYGANRRAMLRGSGGKHTLQEWQQRCKDFGDRCAYCNAVVPLVRDHVVPVSRGGRNDISNIVPACRSCNGRKHAKDVVDFLAELVA